MNQSLTITLGSIKTNYVLFFVIPAMILAPLYTYHMAVKNDEQLPFPHTTITYTACHYPQDIVFRFIMLIGSSVLAFSFYLSFRWISFQAKRVGFPTIPKWQFYLAEFSILCYSIAIGSIDEKGIGKLHVPCAIIFFVVWFAVLANFTFYMSRLREYDTTTINRCSLWIKKTLTFYLIIIWIYCIFSLILEEFDKKQDIYVVIAEWNSFLANLLWLLSLTIDFKHSKLSFLKRE